MLSVVLSIRCVQSNIVLLTQAFRKKFVIPDFQAFTSHIDQLYEKAKKLSGGQVCPKIRDVFLLLICHVSAFFSASGFIVILPVLVPGSGLGLG